MSAVALIEFYQGTALGPGKAVVAALGSPIAITNADNTDVKSWRIELLFAPIGSAYECTVPAYPDYGGVVLAENANGSSPSFAFPALEAEYPGCYRIRLSVWSGVGYTGTKDTDVRNIAVVTPNKKFVIPPPQLAPPPLPIVGTGSKPNELNFNSQEYGWAGDDDPAHRLMNELIHYVDGITSREIVPILAGDPVLNTTLGWRVAGTFSFNPSDFNYAQATIEYLAYVADISNTASLRLWNLTASLQVGTTQSTNSLTPVRLTEDITLTAGLNVYEVHVMSGVDAVIAACSGARLLLN